MRNFLTSGTFWGSILIILGALLVIENVTDINIPVIKVFLSLMLIIIGILVLTGKTRHRDKNTVIFSEANFDFDKETEEYSVVFGQATLDLRNINIPEDIFIKASAVFGEMHIIIDPGMNYKIVSNTAFGSVNMPGNRPNNGFGTAEVKSQNFNEQQPKIIIKADAVFGSINIK
ncbi:MAG: cell wall-active antibiotics response protein [Bacteroidales bacterium]|nr:cell wall-active antibiotics response protein [Bacteroidales bacterium]